MKRKLIRILMVGILVSLMAGCATTSFKNAMWRSGDWNWNRLGWASATRLDGDVPHTTLKTKDNKVLIFQ